MEEEEGEEGEEAELQVRICTARGICRRVTTEMLPLYVLVGTCRRKTLAILHHCKWLASHHSALLTEFCSHRRCLRHGFHTCRKGLAAA